MFRRWRRQAEMRLQGLARSILGCSLCSLAESDLLLQYYRVQIPRHAREQR